MQSGNIWFTEDRKKYSKAKKGSQCPRAKAIVAAGIVQEEGKEKRKKHHSVEKKWLGVQKSPQGISKMKPETPRQEDNTGSHGLKLTKSPVLDITVTRQLKKESQDQILQMGAHSTPGIQNKEGALDGAGNSLWLSGPSEQGFRGCAVSGSPPALCLFDV